MPPATKVKNVVLVPSKQAEPPTAVDGERFRLKATSLSDDVADFVATLVATDELQPGQRVLERELSERLGVSRVPVREAMRILHAQGVVRIEPNRGARISSFGSAELEDMLEMRVSLERTALRRLVKRPSIIPALVSDLRASVEEMRRAALLGDHLAHCRADLSFHRKIVMAADSPLLGPMWGTLSRVVLIFLVREQREWGAVPEAHSRDHEGLAKMLERGESALLEARIESHIMTNYRRRKAKK